MSSRFPRRMVLGLLLLGSATGATAFVVHRMATVGPQPDGAILVPNGQALTPAGAHINLPNLVLILLYDDHTEGTDPAFPTTARHGSRQRPGSRPDRRGDLE